MPMLKVARGMRDACKSEDIHVEGFKGIRVALIDFYVYNIG